MKIIRFSLPIMPKLPDVLSETKYGGADIM